METTGIDVSAVTVVRVVITGFVLVLIAIASTGWLWVGGHQAPAQALASRIVLTLSVVAGLVGMKAIWSRRG